MYFPQFTFTFATIVNSMLLCFDNSVLTRCRVELSSEDDLSPDSDSDAMEVDSTSVQEAAGTREDKRRGSAAANGKASSVAGALVPDTPPQFAVSQLVSSGNVSTSCKNHEM